MSWPVNAPLSSPFGRREGRAHDGIDLAVAEGTPVKAACDGVVAYAGDKLRGYGNLVIVSHGGPLATVYAHNRSLLVREGEAVTRGQTLALSGQTGRASAPHVHFEVRQDERPRDPLEYLSPREGVHGQPNRIARRPNPRRSGFSQARDSVQGRDAAARSRPILPPLH
jgi:murein DD-endopeptidase MepM/ murein hydrolase activator NlpD